MDLLYWSIMSYLSYYKSPVGVLCIRADEDFITGVSVADSLLEKENPSALTEKAAFQLEEYFSGKRKAFALPLCPNGTDFQKRVWNALCEIPYGETKTYKDIAAAVGNEKASRAVGGANNRNPIMIIIPCHRVIGANGSLIGYAGGLKVKEYLLNLEKENK